MWEPKNTGNDCTGNVDGEIIQYDMCSEKSFSELSLDWQFMFEPLGYGFIYSVNDVVQTPKHEVYFYKYTG